jgi:hypothetical protein
MYLRWRRHLEHAVELFSDVASDESLCLRLWRQLPSRPTFLLLWLPDWASSFSPPPLSPFTLEGEANGSKMAPFSPAEKTGPNRSPATA